MQRARARQQFDDRHSLAFQMEMIVEREWPPCMSVTVPDDSTRRTEPLHNGYNALHYMPVG